jgi:hypothetical protein
LDFATAGLDVVHYVVNCLLESHEADWPLLARFRETGHELAAIERLMCAVALYHTQFRALDLLVGREAVGALQTDTTASDAGAITRLARIDDFVVTKSALGTTHSVGI